MKLALQHFKVTFFEPRIAHRASPGLIDRGPEAAPGIVLKILVEQATKDGSRIIQSRA